MYNISRKNLQILKTPYSLKFCDMIDIIKTIFFGSKQLKNMKMAQKHPKVFLSAKSVTYDFYHMLSIYKNIISSF